MKKATTLSSKYLEGWQTQRSKDTMAKSTFFDNKIMTVMNHENHALSPKQCNLKQVDNGGRRKLSGGRGVRGPSIFHQGEDSSSRRRQRPFAMVKNIGSYSSSSDSESIDYSSSEDEILASAVQESRDIKETSASLLYSNILSKAIITTSGPQQKISAEWVRSTVYYSSSDFSEGEESDEYRDGSRAEKENLPSHLRSLRHSYRKFSADADSLIEPGTKRSKRLLNESHREGDNAHRAPSSKPTRESAKSEGNTLNSTLTTSPLTARRPADASSAHVRQVVLPSPATNSTSPLAKGSPGSVGKLRKDLAKNKEIIEMLKSQLLSKGVEPIVDVISYHNAQEKLKSAIEVLMRGDDSAEAEFNKWDEYVRNHPEYKAQQEHERIQWISSNEYLNSTCHGIIRELVPADIMQTTLSRLEDDLPGPIARRVWARKALWLTRLPPESISKLHVADLQTKYSVQGLDEVEMRAIWYALPEKFDNDPSKRKENWKEAILSGLRGKKGVVLSQPVDGELNFEDSSVECLRYIASLQRNAVYADHVKCSEDGQRWMGPYDPHSVFVISETGASHSSALPARPVVNKLTPSRRNKLGSFAAKAKTPVKSKDRLTPSRELFSIPEAVEGSNVAIASVYRDGSAFKSMSSATRKKRNPGPIAVGGNVRLVMEEILMKGLLKYKTA